ncbi:hypothetical protein [Aquipuribacter hungaricus]|uniref:Cytidine deaminase n=1 Tax=Aquipuribacter hungaricus TaxID=545624 RepID=A0ABV7WEI6_9MICO
MAAPEAPTGTGPAPAQDAPHDAPDGAGGREDATLVVLARSAAARTAGPGAAVRDADGRTYLAGAVAVGPLRLGAVEAAVAQAAASGVTRLSAVAVVGDEQPDPALLAAVGDPRVVRA